jgi:hypothetical protein
MDTSIINVASPLQLAGLAVAVVMTIILGARLFGLGAKGYSSALVEIGGLLLGIWVVGRPNDLLGILTKSVGGVQAPQAIHMIVMSFPLPF